MTGMVLPVLALVLGFKLATNDANFCSTLMLVPPVEASLLIVAILAVLNLKGDFDFKDLVNYRKQATACHAMQYVAELLSMRHGGLPAASAIHHFLGLGSDLVRHVANQLDTFVIVTNQRMFLKQADKGFFRLVFAFDVCRFKQIGDQIGQGFND